MPAANSRVAPEPPDDEGRVVQPPGVCETPSPDRTWEPAGQAWGLGATDEATAEDGEDGQNDHASPGQNNHESEPKVSRTSLKRQQSVRESPALTYGMKDPELIRQKVREKLLKPEPYSVFDFYKESGIWQYLAKHPVFENATLIVITCNAVYIAIDTDWNKEPDKQFKPYPSRDLLDADIGFQLMEHLFCAYFSMEWLVRFLAFKKKRNGMRDGWFVFDSTLVFMMVMETWVLTIVTLASGGAGGSPLGKNTSILRLFRLLRLSRLMKMLRSLPELMALIKGMITAMKSVAYVMSLLVLVTYVFAIAFTQLATDTESIGDTFFANVALSMYSLLVYATLVDNLVYFTDFLRFEKSILLPLAMFFIAISNLCILNMLIGVLCEVITAVAATEKEEYRTQMVSEKMQYIKDSLDSDSNDQISYKEFIQIIEKPEALHALEAADVNPIGIVDFAEFFFFEDGEPSDLPFEKFMGMVLDLRESNNATVKDVMNLWMQVKQTTNVEVKEFQQELEVTSRKMVEKFERTEGLLQAALHEVRKVTCQMTDAAG